MNRRVRLGILLGVTVTNTNMHDRHRTYRLCAAADLANGAGRYRFDARFCKFGEKRSWTPAFRVSDSRWQLQSGDESNDYEI